jgi:hypothetical protein
VIHLSKIGFIVKNKSNGKEYFYLRKSIRSKELVSKQNIFSFGNKEKALNNLFEWKKDFNKMPLELKGLGYDLEDVSNWIEQIESK